MKNLKYLLVVCMLVGCMLGINPQSVSAAALKAKISTDCAGSAMIGDQILVKGSYEGGSGAKLYKFRYKLGTGEKVTFAPYGTAKKAYFTPSANGEYTLYCYVKDGKGVVATKTTKVTVANLKTTIKPKSEGYVNNKITITGSATGGFGLKEYKMTYTLNDVVTTVKGYSSTATAKFTPTEPGDYTLKVIARDAKGRKASKTKLVTIKEYVNKEMELRQNLVNTAIAWYGTKEGSAQHKKIVDLYCNEKNNWYHESNGKYVYGHLDLGKSERYKVAWCDIFVSACFIKAGYQLVSGVECGCERHTILLNKKLASWVEDDAYVPTTGDLIFYDWDDSGKGDCKGWCDHVGIVVSCDGKNIKVIEGNMSVKNEKDQVGYRTIKVNGRYIRGFGVPKYTKLLSK